LFTAFFGRNFALWQPKISTANCAKGFLFLRKKKKQKSPYFEEKISQKLSYLDIKFVEVAKTKQNSTLFFSTFLSDLCQIWLILLGMIANPKLDKNERKKTLN
jgi:hypothetical protein